MFNRLLIWQKLAVMALILLLPFFAGVTSLIQEKNLAIDFARRERDGVAFIRPLNQLFATLPLYERWILAPGAPTAARTRTIEGLRSEIEAALETVAARDRLAPDHLKLAKDLLALQEAWIRLRQPGESGAEREGAALSAMQRLQDLRHGVANNSNLILDPALPTYYLMTAALNSAPASSELLARLLAEAPGPTAPGRTAMASGAQLSLLAGLVRAKSRETREDIQQASRADPALEPLLGGFLDDGMARSDAFVRLCAQDPGGSSAALDSRQQGYRQAVAANLALAGRATVELDRLLAERSAALSRGLNATIGSLLVVLATSFAMIVLLLRSITWPLASAVEMANQLASGNLQAQIRNESRDEIGHLLVSMNSMGEALRESARLKQDQIQALEAIDRIKDDFLNVLSHELQTPLSVIFVSGRVLQTEKLGALNEKQSHHLAKMLHGATVLSHLIKDLLDMSHLQAGRFQILRRAMAPAGALSDLVDSLGPLAEEVGVRLVKVIPAELPAIEVDERRIGQVVYNLLDNAIRFSARGDVVETVARFEGDRLRVEVRDRGLGIAPEDHERIFERFVRLDSGKVRQRHGTGLGLAICKAIVEAHGGEIGVVSAPGAGSTFWFELPGVHS